MRSELASDDWAGPVEGDLVAGVYRVTRVLGRGGMGLIVEAVHETDRRRVAIKILRPTTEGQTEATARFLFEAKAIAQIKSVHVTRVFDVATLPDGSPYFVMEYLEGRDLGAVISAEGALPLETAVDYVLQTCEALAETHSVGIVHQDLKPSNLFLTQTLEGATLVKLIDFGISNRAVAGADAELRSTRTRSVMGSPLYMAPEQTRSTRRLDLRADIWSLGIVLHEILTGEMPFVGASLAEVSAAIAVDAPIPCRQQRPDIPEEIERIVLKCLEKEPENRFANVGELAAALLPFGPAEAPLAMKRIAKALERATNATAAPPAPTAATPAVAVPPLRTPAFSRSTVLGMQAPAAEALAAEAPAARVRVRAVPAEVAPALPEHPVVAPSEPSVVLAPAPDEPAVNPVAEMIAQVLSQPPMAMSEPPPAASSSPAAAPVSVSPPSSHGVPPSRMSVRPPPSHAPPFAERPAPGNALLWGAGSFVVVLGIGLAIRFATSSSLPAPAKPSVVATSPSSAQGHEPVAAVPSVQRPAATAEEVQAAPPPTAIAALPPPTAVGGLPPPTATVAATHPVPLVAASPVAVPRGPATTVKPVVKLQGPASAPAPTGTAAFGGSRE